MKEIYFGDKNTFAIRYVSGHSVNKSQIYDSICHLVLDGQIIGDQNEPCHLKSWIYSIEKLKNRIENNFDSLTNEAFINKNDNEIFELILKSNQTEKDHKKEYEYLPLLNDEVWHNSYISLDETTDAYTIVMIKHDNCLKFLWEGWREPCPPERIGQLFSVTVDRNFVLQTFENCFSRIDSDLLL